jgi:hypothetical protein
MVQVDERPAASSIAFMSGDPLRDRIMVFLLA